MTVVGNGSLFKITDVQDRSGELALNVYWYYNTAAPGSATAAAIGQKWLDIFSVWLPPVQPGGCSHTILEVDEVTSPTNFITMTNTVPDGDLTTPYLANFVCASIRLLRSSKITRGGYKRIVAGNEASATNNKWDATMYADLQNLAAVMNDPLSPPGFDFDPVIVRSRAASDPSIDPNDPKTWVVNVISAAEASEYLTTQNTRKLGRGA